MEFIATAKYFFKDSGELSIEDAIGIQPDDLSPVGERNIALLESADFAEHEIWNSLKWTCLAIFEFQDLQDITLPRRGKYFNINYLYLEGITVLRECIVAGLNGQTHASLAACRVTLETIITHYWWKNNLRAATDYEEFYEWLRGNARSKPFSVIMADLMNEILLPADVMTLAELRSVYKALCSYSHKPTKKESLTSIRGSNLNTEAPNQVAYWITFLYSSLSSILFAMIGSSPLSIFPVPIFQKFGFSPPVGIFFDESNFIPLSRAFNSQILSSLKEHYSSTQHPSDTLEWFWSLPDLSDMEILASWDNEKDPIQRDGHSLDEKINLRMTLMKAKMRALHYSFAYGDEGPEMADMMHLFEEAIPN